MGVEENKNQLNPLMTGLAGAVIGVGVGVATSKALSDKKTRERIKETAFSLRNKAEMLLHNKIESLKSNSRKRRESAASK
ncbi:hypothetical protein M1437_00730 [Patescibacteria group bacterium]|nr:hypothetical protein [Patescibacteria group bacterium]